MAQNPRYSWDTPNNRDVEAQVHSIQVDQAQPINDDPDADDSAPEPEGVTEEQLLSIAREASESAQSWYTSNVTRRWSQSYRAYQSRHYQGSKYRSKRWKTRSSLFRPKTRATVRRGDASAASALFSTTDVVTISPQNPSNDMQHASAAVHHELLNYRLDRANEKASISWFQICIGSKQESTIVGMCCSKQYWRYETSTQPRLVPTEEVDEAGRALYRQIDEEVVDIDRPEVDLISMDNCLVEPSAYWINPAQRAGYVLLRYPMTIGAVKDMLQQGDTKDRRCPWRKIDESSLRQATSDAESRTIREAREGGSIDRYDSPNNTVSDYDVVWIFECFMRYGGTDWHFWMLDQSYVLLSDPIPVREAYPAHQGERPIVIGYGTLDAHRTFPMSAVESWTPLQMETNDIANLRLDAVKQAINPFAKVRRGRRIDVRQIQNRSPDSFVMMDDPEKDVMFERQPDTTAGSYQEQDRLNADFDDLAGSFSSGSVQTNRQLNETVGGMQLLNTNANAIAEFDLRVWSETWVEPVLRQLIQLEQYYETDELALAIAGEKAQIREKYGIAEITDDLLTQTVTTRVNVGIGASDPVQKLQKLNAAVDTLIKLFGESIQQDLKRDEIIEEVMGIAGYKDGARFFKIGGGEEDPEKVEMRQLIEELMRQLEDKQADRDHEMALETKKIRGELIQEVLQHEGKKEMLTLESALTALTHPPPQPQQQTAGSDGPPV